MTVSTTLPPPPRTTASLKAQSPTLKKLLKSRLAPIREEQLLAAARGIEKPERPKAWECCGSSCKPCVTDLWREEVKVWKECGAAERVVLEDGERNGNEVVVVDVSRKDGEEREACRIPGAFEW